MKGPLMIQSLNKIAFVEVQTASSQAAQSQWQSQWRWPNTLWNVSPAWLWKWTRWRGWRK